MPPRSVNLCLQEWIDSPRGRDFSRYRAGLLELAETLFFASLATEEKTPTRASIAWALGGADLRDVPDDEYSAQYPELAWEVVALEPRAFDVKTVVKAAPLSEYGRSALVVTGTPGSFAISGVARRNRSTNGGQAFILSAPSPGVISLSYRDEEIFRYERGAAETECPPILWSDGLVRAALNAVGASLQLRTDVVHRAPFQEVTRGLIAGMSRTEHGGLLLFLPTEPNEEMLKSVKLKLLDRMVLARAIERAQTARHARFFVLLARKPEQEGASAREIETEAESRSSEAMLDETILGIARMTAVDNALLIGPSFQVIGAQFEVPSEQPPEVYIATDIKGTVGGTYNIKLHGSRHRAGACFARDHEGALAFVASADGPIRCFLSHQGRVLTWPVRLPEV